MRFKKPKEQILDEIRWGALSHTLQDLSNIAPNSLNRVVESYVKDLVRAAIHDAFDILMDNIYTDEEFEQDLQLKS